MTTDEIMALADEWANLWAAYAVDTAALTANEDQPKQVDKARAALRAAAEQIVRENQELKRKLYGDRT